MRGGVGVRAHSRPCAVIDVQSSMDDFKKMRTHLSDTSLDVFHQILEFLISNEDTSSKIIYPTCLTHMVQIAIPDHRYLLLNH